MTIQEQLTEAEQQRDEERKAHDAITYMCFRAKIDFVEEDNAGKTSIEIVRNLIKNLKLAEQRATTAESRIKELEAWQSKALPYIQAEYSTYAGAVALCGGSGQPDAPFKERMAELKAMMKEAAP